MKTTAVGSNNLDGKAGMAKFPRSTHRCCTLDLVKSIYGHGAQPMPFSVVNLPCFANGMLTVNSGQELQQVTCPVQDEFASFTPATANLGRVGMASCDQQQGDVEGPDLERMEHQPSEPAFQTSSHRMPFAWQWHQTGVTKGQVCFTL